MRLASSPALPRKPEIGKLALGQSLQAGRKHEVGGLLGKKPRAGAESRGRCLPWVSLRSLVEGSGWAQGARRRGRGAQKQKEGEVAVATSPSYK